MASEKEIDANGAEDQAKKDAKKEKLKAEALKLGVPYKELKAQKKAEKEKKRTREASSLQDPEHKSDMKRMRSWSKDQNDPTNKATDSQEEKRRRTRSMDSKDEETAKAMQSPKDWRKEQQITIKGHGKFQGQNENDFPEPFMKFTDAPFVAATQKIFRDLKFPAPTAIQSQVCIELKVLSCKLLITF